jgi:sec-independent protein translocase protein TatA
MANLTGWHALVLLVIVVLLFGATKLPGLAKSVGQSMKIFKNEVKAEEKVAPPADAAPQSHEPQSHASQSHASSEVRESTDSAHPSAKP